MRGGIVGGGDPSVACGPTGAVPVAKRALSLLRVRAVLPCPTSTSPGRGVPAMASHRKRRWSLGGLVLTLTTALVGAALVSANDAVAPRAGAATAAQTWSDEFDGPAGRGPDAAKWTLETGGGGFGNHELEYYTNSTSNASLDGQGHLVITAKKNTDPGLGCWYGQCQ